MRFLIILGLLTALASPFRVRLFEAVLSALLLTPIAVYAVSGIFPVGAPLYYIVAVGILLGWCFFFRNEVAATEEYRSEFVTLGIFVLGFGVFQALCLTWPDFIAIGERLRDYALLSSVIASPIELKEPWLTGFPLNYYAYWYRFGSMFSSMFNLPVWEVYTQLQSFTYALYLTAIFRLCRRHWGFSLVSALFVALSVTLGSNLEGVFHFLKNDHNWWGPSRVIPGAIHEFPVWSFLLGDLHPHYLNLAGIPFALLLFLHLTGAARTPIERVIAGACACAVPFLWIYNSNAWEIPVWAACTGTIGLLALVFHRSAIPALLDSKQWKAALTWRLGITVTVASVLLLSLYFSSRNILPAGYDWRLVSDPVPASQLLDFLRHWGIPLTLLAAALALLSSPAACATALVLAALSLIVTAEAKYILVILIVLQIARLVPEWHRPKAPWTPARIAHEALILAGLVAVLFPELAFLDDPYGGENERMNTIFKFYASAWALLHLAAWLSVRQAVSRFTPIPRTLVYAAEGSLLALMLGFLVMVVPLRSSGETTVVPREQGLSSADREFPGSGGAIQQLRDLPAGTVLEAQGNPYSYTTFVSTLAGKPSFLGWSNHINLLTKQYEEAGRREKITEEFYTASSCERRREILQSEQIAYAVVGTLEKRRHTSVTQLDFSCLKKVVSSGEYEIFSLP